MTYEEAIETIKIAIAEVEWNYPMDYTVAFEKAVEALKKQKTTKWNKTSEAEPTEEKQYLCCTIMRSHTLNFKVLRWSNNLYEVDDCDFYDCKGESGFYYYDSGHGYYEVDCDYWKAID